MDLSKYEPIWNEGFNAYVGPFLWGPDEDGNNRLVLELREEHMNGADHVHGGLLMAFADALMGKAVSEAVDGAMTATVSLNSDFLKGGKAGGMIEGTAEITRRTRSVVFVQGRVTQGESTLLTATGIWKILGAG